MSKIKADHNKPETVKMPMRGGRGGGPGGMHGMGMPVEKPKDFKGAFKKLLNYLKPRKARLIVVFFLAALSTVFAIFSPKVMGRAITRLFEGIMMKMQGVPGASIDFTYIIQILLILAGLYLFSALFSFLMQYIMASVAQNTVYEMRKDVKEKLTRLPLKFFDTHSHGDVLSRMTNDIDLISTTLQQSLAQVITSVVSLIGIIIMMLTISPLLTLVTVLTLPLSFIAVKAIAKRSQKYFAEQQKILGEVNGHIEEMYTGHREVKAFNREKESVLIFDKKNKELYEAGWKAQFVSGIIMPIMMFISNIGYVIICVVGGIFVTKRLIEIGDIQAFIQYSRQFNQPIQQTANIANLLQSTIAAAERVFEILETEEEISDPESPVVITNPKGEVIIEHVDFQYKSDIPLITNMNIAVKAGQSVAIVGPTGAGKTTLVNLLMRFYELQAGKISVDGVDITKMQRGDLRNIFGMVLQDTWLFKGTIRENIAYGKNGATEDEIIAVADSFANCYIFENKELIFEDQFSDYARKVAIAKTNDLYYIFYGQDEGYVKVQILDLNKDELSEIKFNLFDSIEEHLIKNNEPSDQLFEINENDRVVKNINISPDNRIFFTLKNFTTYSHLDDIKDDIIGIRKYFLAEHRIESSSLYYRES